MLSLNKLIKWFFIDQFMFHVSGGGGGSSPGPTSSTSNTSNIPDYARPYVETMLGTAQQQIFDYDTSGNVTGMKPYVPYSSNPQDYSAGFSPLQQQAQSNVANMQTPGAYNTATNYATTAGLGAAGTANPAAQYGGLGANAGLVGMQQGMSYGQNATDPNAVAAYMNPYLQNTLAPAMQLQQQQFGQIGAQNQGQATQAGAFGGGRQAVMQGLNQQNQMLAQNQLVGGAYNQAYNTANQNMQQAASLGMQGTGQAMQGAGIGLQGVGAQQAAYGQLGTQAANLSNIGGQETQSALAINQAQATAGAAQQAQQQNIINQQVQNYATAQQYPMTQLSNMSNLLRGLPMQSTTTQSYQAPPSAVSTLGGLAATGLGAYGASGGFKTAAEGGLMKSYAAGGAVAFDVGGSVTSDLENMDDAHLMQEAKNSPSAQIRQEATKILTERRMEEQAMSQGVGAATGNMQMAGGGIVAFEEGGTAFSDLSKPTRNPNEWRSLLDVAGDLYNPKRVDPKTGIALTQSEYEQGPITPPVAVAPAKETKAKTETPVPTVEAPTTKAGLGNTEPVSGISSDTSKYFKTLQDLVGTPEDRKAISEGIKTSRNEAKAEREQNLWLALMQGGAKAMASKSPFGNVGLGEGAGAAAEGAAYANKAYNLAMKEAQAGELDLAKLNSTERTNLLHYAVTGAVSDANTRTKMQELKEIAATRAQGAGQANLARQDAAVTARAKLILGNNPMPTEQDVQNAIDTATRQVMGKSAGPSAQDQQALTWAKANPKDPRAATIMQRLSGA
jgi:hypothetical protein